MNHSRLLSPGFLAVLMLSGGVTAITPACSSGSTNSSSGSSGSGAQNSVGGGGSETDVSGGGNASSNGTGGDSVASTGCPTGNERCACYGNNTCNTGLVCASQHCVNITGLLSTGGAPADVNGGATGNVGDNNLSGTTTGGSSTAAGNAGGTGTGGTGAIGDTSATGGALATGGDTTVGTLATGGAATGGAPATGGTLGTGGVSFWKSITYNPNGLPDPSDGNHNPGLNCIQCHTRGANSEAPIWSFGGTVYKADGTTPAPHVQVGVNDGTNLYTAYSATNGNFWFGGSGTINWASAQVRIRNAKGELSMAGATPAATCNLCHNSTTYPRITEP